MSAQQKEQARNKLKSLHFSVKSQLDFFDIHELFEEKNFTKRVSKLDQTLDGLYMHGYN